MSGSGGRCLLRACEGFVTDERVDAGGYEAWASFTMNGFLAHAIGDSDAAADRFVGGMRRAIFLQLHFGDRVEEVCRAAFAMDYRYR